MTKERKRWVFLFSMVIPPLGKGEGYQCGGSICHSEPVRTLAWESPESMEIATPVCGLVRNDMVLKRVLLFWHHRGR